MRLTSRPVLKGEGRRIALLTLAVSVLAAMALAPAAGATISGDQSFTAPTFSWTEDALGPNDVPNQKDLTAHSTVLNSNLYVGWKWDDTSFSGKNTGDACALFNTDGDAADNIDAALCVTVDSAPATWRSTRVYTCGNTKNDRCTSTYAEVQSIASKCQVDNAAAGQFPTGTTVPDTQASCLVATADFGSSSAALVNTCSYPSREPTSAPSDCVLIPGVRETGAIQITKTGDDARCTGTTLPTHCAAEGMSLLQGAVFAITGTGVPAGTGGNLQTGTGGTVCLAGLPTGNTYTVTETGAPTGYQIDDTFPDNTLFPGVQTSKTVAVSSAGNCTSGAATVGFTDSPVSTIDVVFTSPGSAGVTTSQISCSRGSTALTAGTAAGANTENGGADTTSGTPNRDDTHEAYAGLTAGTYTCTIDIAP